MQFCGLSDELSIFEWYSFDVCSNVSITQHIPWIARTVRAFPGLNKWMRKFTEYGIQQAIKRANTEVKRKDLFYYMVSAYTKQVHP